MYGENKFLQKKILFGEVEELGKKRELSYQKLAHHLDQEKKIKHKGKEVVKMWHT